MDQKMILIDSESVVANLAWMDRIYDGSELQILFQGSKKIPKILPYSWKYLFIIQSGSRCKAVGFLNLKV